MHLSHIFQIFPVIVWILVIPPVRAQSHAAIPPQAAGIIYSVDGSGGGEELTTNLWHEVVLTKVPYCIERIPWSRYSWAPKDHADVQAHLKAAAHLASRAQAFRQAHPDKKIIFMGFSSGTHVVLAAAAMMPPDSVDRIFVFAPSVSFNYPLGPVLRASRAGLDVFYSHEDAILSSAVGAFGTADGKRVPVSGHVGFWLPSPNSPDAALYQQRLRQYPWVEEVQWTGHYGDHPGWLERKFLRAYIMPKLKH
jgi:pimeloyl-ACP methyl ester carboxylesterase